MEDSQNAVVVVVTYAPIINYQSNYINQAEAPPLADTAPTG